MDPMENQDIVFFTEDRIVFFMRLLLLCCEILENANGFPVPNESLSVYSAITGELSPAQRGQLHFVLARVLMAIQNLWASVPDRSLQQGKQTLNCLTIFKIRIK